MLTYPAGLECLLQDAVSALDEAFIVSTLFLVLGCGGGGSGSGGDGGTGGGGGGGAGGGGGGGGGGSGGDGGSVQRSFGK